MITISTKKILLVSGLALLVVTVGSLSVYFYLSKKQTDKDNKSKEIITDITVTTKTIQLSIDNENEKKDTITDITLLTKSIQVDSSKAEAEIRYDTKVIVPSPLDIDMDTTTQTTINNTNSHTTSTLLDTSLQTSQIVKTTRVNIPKRLSPRASKNIQNKPTIVFEDFVDSSFDLHDNDDGPTEAEISEAYINLARKSVLENESPKRRAAREAREEKARIEMENKITTTTTQTDSDFGNVEEERRQLSKTAASQAAAVASVHILANASGGRSLRSPLRSESRGMTHSKLVDVVDIDHSTTSPKKLADEFASVASPSKVGIRRQIVAEMKVRRY